MTQYTIKAVDHVVVVILQYLSHLWDISKFEPSHGRFDNLATQQACEVSRSLNKLILSCILSESGLFLRFAHGFSPTFWLELAVEEINSMLYCFVCSFCSPSRE